MASEEVVVVITKVEVEELLGRFHAISEQVLESPKFDQSNRESAVNHVAAYMLALGELVSVSGEEIDSESVQVVMLAAEYLQLLEEFCR